MPTTDADGAVVKNADDLSSIDDATDRLETADDALYIDDDEADEESDAFSYDRFSSDVDALFPQSSSEADIDAALATLGMLPPLAAAEQDASPPYIPPRYDPALPTPRPLKVRRGSALAVLPALALIAVGIGLTIQTTTASPLNPLLLAAGGLAALVIVLLGGWLAGGRWSRGLLVIGLGVLAVSGVLAAGLLPGGIDLTLAYPLLIAGLGSAVTVAGVIGRPLDRRWIAVGLLVMLAGGIGLAVTGGVLPTDLLASIAPLWPILVVIVAAIWLSPLVFRRRRTR